MFLFIGVGLSCNDLNTEHCKAPTTRMFTISHFFTNKKVEPEVGVHYNNQYGSLSCTLRKPEPALRSSNQPPVGTNQPPVGSNQPLLGSNQPLLGTNQPHLEDLKFPTKIRKGRFTAMIVIEYLITNYLTLLIPLL